MKNIDKTACCLSLALMLGTLAQAQQINAQTAGYNSMHTIDTASTILNPTSLRHVQHVYTNHDLTLYAAERAANTSSPLAVATTAQPAGTTQAFSPSAQDKQTAEDMKRQTRDLRRQIALLERDVDMNQREMKLRRAYGDSGMLWSNDPNFAERSQKLHDGLQGKQQQLADAKQKLEALKEQARKAGVQLD